MVQAENRTVLPDRNSQAELHKDQPFELITKLLPVLLVRCSWDQNRTVGSRLILWIESSWGVSGLRENDPELLTEAVGIKAVAAAAGSWRASQRLTAALLRVNASREPGGLSSWGWHCREGRLLCLEVEHSWGKHRSGNSLLSSPAGPADSISRMAEGNTGSHLGHWDWRARPRKETSSISPHSWEPSSHCGWVLHLWGSMRGSGQENP